MEKNLKPKNKQRKYIVSTGMKFGKENFAMLIVKSGKRHRTEGFDFFVSWYINFCRLFNAKAILLEEQL